jgi:CheY-like chemotaxis protein
MAAGLEGKRVLIVEDQFLIADDLQRILREDGAKVVGPVGRRDEALIRIYNEPIDLAVLDIKLDDEEVYPAVDELRRRGIPFVFVTGYAPQSVRPDYRSAPYVEKPYEPAKLRALLRRLAATERNEAHT